MFVLKVISTIYTAGLLIFFISIDCESKDRGKNIGYNMLSLLQVGALAYIIMN